MSNLVLNTLLDPALVDVNGDPLFWSRNGTWNDETTGIANMVTVPRMDGQMGPVLRVSRAPGGTPGDGPMWEQAFTTSPVLLANPFYTRNRAIPNVGTSFPPAIKLTLTSKGTGLGDDNPGNKLTARWVNYYYDPTPDLNMDDGPVGTGSDYHWAPGPSGQNGMGDWPWRVDTYTMPVYSYADTIYLRFDIGLHDGTAYGELLFYDAKFELIP